MGKIYIDLIIFSEIVKLTHLTKNEEKVTYGLVRYPGLNDSELSSIIGVKLSTLTSIKRRLSDRGFFRNIVVPMLNRLGCELLAVIYTQFNPVIPLEERVTTTRKTIEVFEEIFFSAGEQEKGFSVSMSKNYTNIGRINEIRTETFGKVGLLEKEYPNEVIFPFEISHISRFFDFSRVLNEIFSLENVEDDGINFDWFNDLDQIELTNKEKTVYAAIVEHSDFTTQQIGDIVGLSRHTVSRMKKQFFENNLLKKITFPNLNKFGFEILAFYHIEFNPNMPPSKRDIEYLDTPSTIFLASKKFEIVMISAYSTYQEYKEAKMRKIRFLKEKGIISYTPLIGKYMFERMTIIKDFDFAPIVKKILNMRLNKKRKL